MPLVTSFIAPIQAKERASLKRALQGLSNCMRKRPRNVRRVEQDPGYIARLVKAMKAVGDAVPTHRREVFHDYRYWTPSLNQEETWLRNLLQLCLDATTENVTRFLGHDSGGVSDGVGRGGSVRFFDDMAYQLRNNVMPAWLIALAANKEPAEKRTMRLSEPRKVLSPTDARGRWMYRLWLKNKDCKQIKSELAKIAGARGWELLGSPSAIHTAIDRYCKKNKIKMPRRKPR